ncbi:hypothetical protein XENTR_v10019188 [Xenopus tropicalis]|nr:hypothetical protein XENTR_v10019188 [Xenopus tropicalis]
MPHKLIPACNATKCRINTERHCKCMLTLQFPLIASGMQERSFYFQNSLASPTVQFWPKSVPHYLGVLFIIYNLSCTLGIHKWPCHFM